MGLEDLSLGHGARKAGKLVAQLATDTASPTRLRQMSVKNLVEPDVGRSNGDLRYQLLPQGYPNVRWPGGKKQGEYSVVA